jgi:hypothetical protein
LNGRKVDQEKGCILKAEMAKKNLHTKSNKEKTAYEAFYSVGEFSRTPIPTSTQSSSNINNNRNSIEFMGNKKGSNIFPISSLSTSSLVEYPFLLHKLYNKASHHQNDNTLSQLIVSSTTSTPILSSTIDPTTYNIDQNPPCNTLYVGNLPMNTNEKELRSMFSDCPGYKRLSFRNNAIKSNGPMCFVEFEDIPFATLALKELHGKLLSNSVKGGIRLSYSKNPLVREKSNLSHYTTFVNF